MPDDKNTIKCSKCGLPKLMCKCPPPGDADDDDNQDDDSNEEQKETDLENPGDGSETPTNETPASTGNQTADETLSPDVTEQEKLPTNSEKEPEADEKKEDAEKADEKPFNPSPFSTQCKPGGGGFGSN